MTIMGVDDNILAQIGLHGDVCDGKKDVAIEALRHLITSGKVSMDDAKVAVQAAHGAQEASSSNALPNKGGTNGKNLKKKKQKGGQPKTPEKYRTRHVALQFSYDGTDFTGFAENVGKEYDNSVEKALFAALQKTRLMVSPEENGSLSSMVSVHDEDNGSAADRTEPHAKQEVTKELSARTASQYSRCGRTDKGVHAHGQVVALYLKSAFPLAARQVGAAAGDAEDALPGDLLTEDSLPKNSLDGLECLVPQKKSQGTQKKTIHEYDYPRILNNILPPAVRVLGWCPVSPTFSARFSCFQRTYRYFFPRRNLDLSAVAQGLQYMMGRHDFRNLCKMNCEQVYNFERVLLSGKVVSPQQVYVVAATEDGDAASPSVEEIDDAPQPSPHDICHIEIIGQAFLWHQIRCIVAVLFYVGRRLEAPECVPWLLDVATNPAKPSYEMASETALVLQECRFQHLKLGRTVRNLWDVTKGERDHSNVSRDSHLADEDPVLEERWENHALAAERAKNALGSIKHETEVRWSDVVDFVEKTAKNRKKKEQKRTDKRTDVVNMTSDEEKIARELETHSPGTSVLSWARAVHVIAEVLGACPHLPHGSGLGRKRHTEAMVHVPLMERAKGTTYEEKVRAILGDGGGADGARGKSTKRKDRYEDNIVKKRKTAAEDKAFYDRMLRQGGSSV